MDARELRIDNYVNKRLKSGNGRIVFSRIGAQDIARIKEGIGSFVYEPIPLSEELLIKAGSEVFKFDHKENQYRLGNRLMVIRDGNFYDYGSNVIIEYLHKLQNLFYELEGKELNIEL